MSSTQLPTEIWYMILQHTNDYWTLRGTYLTCQLFAEFYITNNNHGHRIYISHKNQLLSKILHLSGCPWDWKTLSKSRIITTEFKIANLHLPWKWCGEELRKMEWQFLSKIIHQFSMNNWYLSTNIHIPLDFIINNINGGWNWSGLCRCRRLEELEVISSIKPNELRWDIISSRCNITEEYIITHINTIRFRKISADNKNISWKFIKENIHKNWNWAEYTKRSDFPAKLLLNHQPLREITISCSRIVERKDIPFCDTYNLIKKYNHSFQDCYDKRNCMSKISRRADIDWEIVETNIDDTWDYDRLSQHNNFPEVFRERYPDKSWRALPLSVLTINDVDFNITDENIDFAKLSRLISQL